jgi:hypothetical protein
LLLIALVDFEIADSRSLANDKEHKDALVASLAVLLRIISQPSIAGEVKVEGLTLIQLVRRPTALSMNQVFSQAGTSGPRAYRR